MDISLVKNLIDKYKVVDSSECIKYGGNFLSIKDGKYVLRNGEVIRRECVVKKSEVAVTILAITKDGKVVLVVEPRVATREGVGVGVPAGYVEVGESPVEAALRELEEETGYTTDKAYLVDGYYPSEGASGEYVYLVLALDCIKSCEQRLDDSEYISFIEVDYDDVFHLMKEHIINNGHSRILMYETQDMVREYLKKDINCKKLEKGDKYDR